MWKLVDVQIIYKKLYQRELVTSDWFFVIRNSCGVQIFRNDEKARQRHLPKMYTLVVTMNWNRFRKMFRIRFCIFYNRSELTHCIVVPQNQNTRPGRDIGSYESLESYDFKELLIILAQFL